MALITSGCVQDGSGLLDEEEVAKLAEKMGYELDPGELSEAMYQMDADGSGEVDFDEFAEWWMEYGDEKSKWMQMLNERDNKKEKDLRAAFNTIDLDGAATPQHGLLSNRMALITSDCDLMRAHEHQMALITSECVPLQAVGRSTTTSSRSSARRWTRR